MRKLIIFLLLFTFSLQLSFAQVEEALRSMSKGVNNALVMDLPNMDDKFVLKVWKKYIKQYDGKTRKNRKSDEHLTEQADISAIGGIKPVNVYALIEDIGDGVQVTTWYEIEEVFLTSIGDKDAYVEAEKFMVRFGLEVARELTRIELSDQEKELAKLESELKRLKRANDGFHREIEVARDRIAKAEKEIENNLKDQEDAEKRISMQQKVVKEVRDKLSEF